MRKWTPLQRSRALRERQSGLLVSVGPRRARWRYVRFAARRIVAGDRWVARTGGDEACLVLLSGLATVTWSPGQPRTVRLGPRRNVFADYPHAVYLPPRTSFEVRAVQTTEVADCRAPTSERHPAREIRPEDCGFEVRGGGNATRQIIDILPPSAKGDRLLVCEVLTPGGNWSSYPPHKHDRHRPPGEADLDETYYYRFGNPSAYGIQRLYTADGRSDQALTVTDGDVVIVRSGYHPFVAAHGYDAYYLNTLAGSMRSMAATDDPRYAHVRSKWPPPDPRVPLIQHPARTVGAR
ncbi:MAG TPA: 5-deoxy-glucuronate isomerase [Vicinamibacterales bacterium]|nr:5-deoxy-glucuronate isomerase [Vicinamibacterales bacterium]